MITLKAHEGSLTTTATDVLVCFVFEDKDMFKERIASLRKAIKRGTSPLDTSTFSGKEKETLLLYPEGLDSSRLLLVGLGKTGKISAETLRRASAIAAKTAANLKANTLAILEPPADILSNASQLARSDWSVVGTALGEGAVLALYKFDKYLTGENRKKRSLRELHVITDSRHRRDKLQRGLDYASLVCEATCLARDLSNAPPNEIYPETLARRAVEAGRKSGVKVQVLDEKRISRLRMGGLVGVSQGSARPPRFIIMEYGAAQKGRPTVVLVGKGVTFDAGGISIKPAAGMSEMKTDMSGAAAVIGTLYAVARLKLPVHLVGLVPATENLLGGRAMKPGDILTHLNGKTSEIDNTDAEGRLILADALAYAARYKPDLVIDLATLTGACVVALGHYATGMMGNDQDAMDRIRVSGDRTYERVWQLPMFEEYERLIKSDVADVKNSGGPWGGAITAALFLKKFIGNYPWVHLDIAGTAVLQESLDYTPKGGSGVGVRLLVDVLRNFKK